MLGLLFGLLGSLSFAGMAGASKDADGEEVLSADASPTPKSVPNPDALAAPVNPDTLDPDAVAAPATPDTPDPDAVAAPVNPDAPDPINDDVVVVDPPIPDPTPVAAPTPSPDDVVPTPTPTPTPTPVQTPGTPNSDVTISTALSDDFTATIMQGRVATLELPDDDVASVRMISGPDYGNVTVNPDNTLAVVLTGTKSTDDLSFEFEVTHDDGSTSAHTANLEVTAGLQKAGWGLGDFYMLETDEDDNVVVEHGENHRKVYVSGDDDALTIADIAALEGKDVGKINQNFFRHNTEYGATEDMALAEDAADLAWRANSGWSTKNTVKDPTSNWLLFEKGYEYNDIRIMTEGESELNPTYIGSYGEGERPIINDRLSATKEGVDHIVIQGLDIRGGAAMLVGQDVLFDDLHFSETEVNIQGIDGFTMRNSQIIDVWNEDPRKGDTWSPHADRESGIYMARVQGALYENNFFDHNGWEDGYDYNLDGDAPQPPSMFSHNVYFASANRDVTFRDNIVMRGAATGVQMRPGGVIEDNVFLDNNSGILLAGGGYSDAGNYSLFTDNLVTSGAHKTTSEGTGARTQGVVNKTQLTTLMDNIVTHLADPNDPNGLDGKGLTQNPLHHHDSKVFYDDTIVYNWAGKTLHDQRFDENNSNIDGLNSDILDETTIQNFTANLLGKDTATIGDLADYLRGQADGSLDDVVDADLIIQFFQTGFGLQTTLRSDAETLRFIPDELGDGVRWDNRLNWSTEDLPGTQDGDSVDLAGNWVYYGGTNRIEDIDFGEGGKLFVTHGYLEIEGDLRVGDAGADLNIDRAGQFWTDGYTDQDMLSINADGGRFANTGLFTGNTELTATDNAQVILASDGADFVLGDDSRLEIIGGDTKVGFDGAENGTGVLLMADDATLSFTAKDGEIGQIREFYSGHFSDSKGIQSGINLGDATLDLDVTDLAGGTESTLISVDELIGAFGDINIAGLGAKQDASIIVDYENDQVLLNLGEAGVGSGSQRIYTKGDANDAQANGDLWDALTNGHGIYPEDLPEDIPDDPDMIDV